MLFHKALAASVSSSNNWLYDFASSTNFWPYGVAVDSEDNIIAVGRTSEDTAGGTDAIVFKISSSGELIWSINYGDAGENQYFRNVCVDSSDNIYVCGQTHNSTTNSKAFWMKLNSDGDIQIEKTAYDGSGGYERAYAIQVDNSGYIYLFADIERNNAGNIFPYIILYDSSGTKLNSYYMGNFYNQNSSDTQRIQGTVNSDGSVIAFGFWNRFQSNNTFGAWQRSGSTLSQKNSPLGLSAATSPPAASDYIPWTSTGIDSSNNIYYYIGDSNSGTDTGCIFKRNSSGAYVAQIGFGYFNNALSTAFYIDANDNPIAALYYGIIAEFDSSLNLTDSIRITRAGSGNTSINGLARLSNGNVVVVGRDYYYSSGSFIASVPMDGSANGVYGNWTVGDYNPTVSSSINGLTTAGTTTTASSDSISETDPNYTQTDATITYTKY
jgi:hypothetical protein